MGMESEMTIEIGARLSALGYAGLLVVVLLAWWRFRLLGRRT